MRACLRSSSARSCFTASIFCCHRSIANNRLLRSMRATIRPIRSRFCPSSAVSSRQRSRHLATACNFHRNTTLVDVASIASFSVMFSRQRWKAANMPAFFIRRATLSITPCCQRSSRTLSRHRRKLAASAACIIRLTTLCMTTLRRSSSARPCRAADTFCCHKSIANQSVL